MVKSTDSRDIYRNLSYLNSEEYKKKIKEYEIKRAVRDIFSEATEPPAKSISVERYEKSWSDHGW